MRVIRERRQFREFMKNEELKNETEKRKKTWLDFGFIWSVLYLSNRYERVFTNLTVVADFTNVELQLNPILTICNSFSLQFSNTKFIVDCRCCILQNESEYLCVLPVH